MKFDKSSPGTRGSNARALATLMRPLQRLMMRLHRRSGNTFQGMDILYLETVGAKSGKERQTPLAYFHAEDAENSWLIVASLGGAATNPAWYHNLAAHSDQVGVEVDGHRYKVAAEQLDGERREKAWQRIVSSQRRYAEYQEKTDRVLPVIRLSRID
jgi:deazaflavin-dependent oxidoreductase (nitroreductase family)